MSKWVQRTFLRIVLMVNRRLHIYQYRALMGTFLCPGVSDTPNFRRSLCIICLCMMCLLRKKDVGKWCIHSNAALFICGNSIIMKEYNSWSLSNFLLVEKEKHYNFRNIIIRTFSLYYSNQYGHKRSKFAFCNISIL